MYKTFIKPTSDFLLSLISLLVLLPVILFLTFFLAIVNKGKPFFTQLRPGKNGKTFKVIKFRTMNNNRDKKGTLLPDSDRLTGVGRFIRKTSLDELPQLFNVLVGDMSLIGPRPLLVEYLPLYNNEQKRRHEVRPGITGWAQVNGRNTISWQQKFSYDVWYVDNISFGLDLKISLMTIKKVIVGSDISQDGHATMEYFTGDN